jgi:Mn2+/Fe2+ NRAMP family transporter
MAFSSLATIVGVAIGILLFAVVNPILGVAIFVIAVVPLVVLPLLSKLFSKTAPPPTTGGVTGGPSIPSTAEASHDPVDRSGSAGSGAPSSRTN